MGEGLPEPMQAAVGLEVADIHSGDGDETVLVGMVADSHYRQWLEHNLLVGVEWVAEELGSAVMAETVVVVDLMAGTLVDMVVDMAAGMAVVAKRVAAVVGQAAVAGFDFDSSLESWRLY